jgi:DNA-directed RNA polymerase specialized sigma24 family protein
VIEYQLLKQEIELEYERIIDGMQRDKNHLFELLNQYIRKTIEITIRSGGQASQEDLEEVMQNTMLAVLERGLTNYSKQGKSFAGYCCMIARNKAIDFVKRRRRDMIAMITIDSDTDYSVDEKIDNLLYQLSRNNSGTPESRLLTIEGQLEHIRILKRFLHIIMNRKEKAYKTVGCCYTIILFQLLNPKSKELSSPAWAFEELKNNKIQFSADRFLDEFNKRVKLGRINWGTYFQESMESEEFGELICNIIFGERFKRKDLENWSLRFRNKLKDEICYEFD